MEESGDAHKKNKKKFHTTKIQTTTYLYVYIRVLYGKKGMPFFRTNLSTTYFFPLTLESAFEFTPTLLVNKFSWSYHKVALDLWGSRIWLNVSIFYQFHKAKSRYLSSEPGHWFKKQLSKFSWNQSKDLTFAQIFAFCDLNVIFDNSNWIECVYILKFQIG